MQNAKKNAQTNPPSQSKIDHNQNFYLKAPNLIQIQNINDETFDRVHQLEILKINDTAAYRYFLIKEKLISNSTKTSQEKDASIEALI